MRKSYLLLSTSNLWGDYLATTLRFPLFIKPCSAGGSFGIKRCNNLAELDRAILDLRSKQYGLSNETVKTAIVQEFIDAPEYSLNAVSYAGKHYITGVWLYEKSYHDGDIPCYVEANLVNLAPSMRQTIQAFVDDSLNALEWQYGFSHIEFFWHQNKPVMVEVNFRLPGVFGFLCNLEKSAYGDDQVTILNKLIKKNEVAHHNLHPQGKARILFLSNRIPYTVPTFSPEAFHKIESVVLFRQNIISGSSMPPAKSLSDCILYIGLYNEDERQLNRDTQLINDLLNRNYGLQ